MYYLRQVEKIILHFTVLHILQIISLENLYVVCNTYLDESLIFSFNNLRMNEWNLTEMLKAQSRFS
jgi:hypothetical protein